MAKPNVIFQHGEDRVDLSYIKIVTKVRALRKAKLNQIDFSRTAVVDPDDIVANHDVVLLATPNGQKDYVVLTGLAHLVKAFNDLHDEVEVKVLTPHQFRRCLAIPVPLNNEQLVAALRKLEAEKKFRIKHNKDTVADQVTEL